MEQLHNLYYKYRHVAMNVALFCSVVVCFISKTDSVRSLSFGIAAGIALITLGESITRLRVQNAKAASQE